MKKKILVAAISAALVSFPTLPPALAAAPDAGTISSSKRTLSWEGGPFMLSQPGPTADCLGGPDDPTCDHFALTINLGEGARIEVAIKAANPCSVDCLAPPVEGDDYDLFVYAPNGALVGEGTTPGGNEKVTFQHRARYNGQPYEVRVAPWLVMPGSTYTGTVEAQSLGR